MKAKMTEHKIALQQLSTANRVCGCLTQKECHQVKKRVYKKNAVDHELQARFAKQYAEQEAQKKKKKPSAFQNLNVTNHAQLRFAERFQCH